MAKKAKDRGNVVSVDIVKAKCMDCETGYTATKTVYENGDIVISPQRCEPCQITHLTNLRVNTTIKKIQLLGNLKTRIFSEKGNPGLQAVLDALSQEVTSLADRYSGTSIKLSAFDLKKVKV